MLARITGDADERRRCLAEGAAVLAAGAPAHNHVYYYREAIEAAIDERDWPAARSLAAQLRQAFDEQPLGYTELVASRAEALAAVAEGQRGATLRARLDALLQQATARRWQTMRPALQAAAELPGWGDTAAPEISSTA
jgi:hypothetical protein